MPKDKKIEEIKILEELVKLAEDKAREESKDSLIRCCRFTDKFFEVSEHHKLIADKLEAVERGDIKRLIIAMPPRHGKSRMASQEFPAWYLGRNPSKHVMISSYSATLAESFSRKARERVRSREFKEIFDLKLKDDSQNIKHWETQQQGGFIAAGVGGAITGKGFHLGIIDDPISNREEAESQLMRDKVWDWYTSTFYTRQEKDAAMVVIMTRWHEDDLVGRLIENMNKGGEQWEVLHLKAISDDGKALWNNKYNIEKLNQIKSSIGPRDFNSLYQGQPYDETGGAFKKEMFNYYEYSNIEHRNLSIITFVDPAISLRESADYTAIVTIAQDEDNNIYVLDVFRERVEPDELIKNLFRIADEWNPERIGIENVAYQKMLILEVRKQMQLMNRFYTIEEVKPMGEKEARIKSTLQPRYSNGNIYHNYKCQDLETELLRFPDSKHDDVCDALSGAAKLLDINFGMNESEETINQWASSYGDDDGLQGIL